jgi:hypothetical protein
MFAILLVLVFLVVAAFPGLTLFSGQVIKQFETFSLAESIARTGWNPYATSIPCDGGIRWVLEFPLYAGIGGAFVRLFPEMPSIFPVAVYALFLWAVARLRRRLDPNGPVLVWLAVATAPVFLRFSTQFLPDPLAVALLAHGVASWLGRRRGSAAALFLAAVTVKPTVIFSLFFFLVAYSDWILDSVGDYRKKAKGLVKEGLRAVVFALPFVAWAISLRALAIPSPLHEGGLLAIGKDWGILLDPKFYSKFFVWTVFKGVGPILAAFVAYSAIRWRKGTDETLRLLLWSAGIIPYWLVVRRLNVIHDYYSLSFFLPIALAGAMTVRDLLWNASPSAPWILRGLLLASVLQGIGLFVRAGIDNPPLPVAGRPVFCGTEFRSESLMGIPRTEIE